MINEILQWVLLLWITYVVYNDSSTVDNILKGLDGLKDHVKKMGDSNKEYHKMINNMLGSILERFKK